MAQAGQMSSFTYRHILLFFSAAPAQEKALISITFTITVYQPIRFSMIAY